MSARFDRRLVGAALLLLAFAACDAREADHPESAGSEREVAATKADVAHERAGKAFAVEIASPAAPGGGQPNLVVGGQGEILMTWTEPGSADGTHRVRFSKWQDGSWSEPSTVVERPDLFVNWADFPSIRSAEDGTLFVHWLQKSGEDTYAYDVRVSASTDGGTSWTAPTTIHDDGTRTEHGFVSMVPAGGDDMSVIWLDGRHMSTEDSNHGSGSMTLQYASIDSSGEISSRSMLDDRTCECCQSALAMTSRGLVAAYRDRSEEEIRDIAVVRQVDGTWTAPTIISPDGWEIAGCPVNGPQIDGAGERVAVSWFTAAGGESRVFLALSSDSGATFGKKIRIDDGSPIGRVDVEFLSDGSALVTWVEQAGDGAEIKARRVSPDGRTIDTVLVGVTTTARSSGFPRAAASGQDLVFFGWTQPGEPSTLRVSTVDFGGATE